MNALGHIDRKKMMWGGGIILILVALLVYLGGSDAPPPALSELSASPLESVLGRELLGTLERLKSTTLDVSVFEDVVFKSLQDFGVDIAPQPVGRRNPFAPFEGTAAAASAPAGIKKTPASPPTALPSAPDEADEEEFEDFSF
ncbi:MAG: hypothetical protein Q7R88_01830 [bacterium]|nr:hypothetical protein [bacterium]